MKKTLLIILLAFFAQNFLFAQQAQYNVTLQTDNSTSGNSRAPQGFFRYIRNVYLITATEMTAGGFVNGDALVGIGFNYSQAQNLATTGTMKIYLQNTADATNTKSTTWSTAITGMTTASNGNITIPAASGQFNYLFNGGSTFTYTGGGLYVAFEYDNPSGTLPTTGNVALCNTVLTNGLKSAQSSTAVPTTISSSSFRPMTYLAKSVPCAAIDGLTTSANSDTSSTISWSSPLDVQLEWGVYPYTQGSGGSSASVTANNTYTITGLTSGKAYDVYVRKNCGGGLYSSWRKITTGTTSTTPVSSYPYSMNFEPAADQAFLYNLGWGNQSSGNVGGWSWYTDDTTDNNTANDFSHTPDYFIGSSISATTAQNAWVFSKPLAMSVGSVYTINYYYRTYSTAATTGAVNFSVGINSTNSGTGATILASYNDYNNLAYTQGSVQFTPTTSGNYYLGFLNNTPARTGITTTNYVFIDTVTISGQLNSEEVIMDENNITVYPNPTTDVLFIKSNSRIISANVYDSAGRKINLNIEDQSINVKNLKSGAYILDIETENGKKTQKFIKQ